MTTRRKFLTALGLGVLTPRFVLAQDEDRARQSWFSKIFAGEESVDPTVKPDPSTWSNETITAAWLGHATVLINFFGAWILTDPVFAERIGLNILRLFTIGPRRLIQPALKFEELPKIDLILLSHAHMDHLDIATLARFKRDIPLVMAKNTSDVVENMAWKHVYELDWGEKVQVGDVEIEALEVKHFGWRYPWEEDRSRGNWHGRSYNAYLVSKNGHHIVFGGDTAYQKYFHRLGERGIDVELAIMPIGAYDPWISNHCSPEQAVHMADQMTAKAIMPIHWRTFVQSNEPTFEPIERFKRALASQPERIALEEVGETWRKGHLV
jgi:L-ascorbate metabolism protein UlaG (beta-lactamase superfamily)